MPAQLSFNPPTRLLIVTVNYRTAALVVDSLRSLEPEIKAFPGGAQIAVVDNQSGDNSLEVIGQEIATNQWQDWATLLPAPLNGGYSYGNNYAIRSAMQSAHPPDYVLLLNPDTQVRPAALTALVEFMDHHPQVGIAGSSFEEADGKPWPYAFRFPNVLSELEAGLRLGVVSKVLSPWAVAQTMGDQPQQVDWLPGASMMIRRSVFEAIGLMDEGYFLYFEETDFCLQARRAGWECWYVPTSRVMHILGQSTGVTATNQAPKRRPQYWFDSRRRYFLKNHGLIYTALVDASWLVGFGLWRLRRVLQQKPDCDPPQLLQDSWRNSVLFRQDIPCQQLPNPQ
jgi:N-acetylglucosaminyl-diphospho-decaprenol L-rhamnosyltransferase